MKREKASAEKVSKQCKVSAMSFRRMLRDEVKMDIDVFNDALDYLGYKIMIVKKEDLV